MDRTRGNGTYVLASGRRFECPRFDSGFAAKKAMKLGKSAASSPRQLEFLAWAYAQGQENKGKKLGPRRAELLMALHGTAKGKEMFPADPYWDPAMRVLADEEQEFGEEGETMLKVLCSLARGSPPGQVLALQPRAARPNKRAKKQRAPLPPKLAPKQIEQEAAKKLALVMSLRRSERAQRMSADWLPTFRRSELLEVSWRTCLGGGGGRLWGADVSVCLRP